MFFADPVNASLGIDINSVEGADSVVTNEEKGSIFYPFNPFIAIPVSICSGIVFEGIFITIIPEDETDPLSGVAVTWQA